MQSPSDRIIGYALGGGAARGLAHIGVLKVLEEQGSSPVAIAGTSMGALVGAVYASGRGAAELEQMALEVDWRRLAYLADITLPMSGLFKGRRVTSWLKSLLGEVTFAELKVPFACVATDIWTGRQVVFSRGPVVPAIRASIAIPGIFTPARVAGRYLVDGALVNEVPVKVCRGMGAAYIIAVNVSPNPSRMLERPQAKPPRLIDVLTQSLVIAGYHIAKANVRHADLVISPLVEDIGPWQFHRAAEAIAAGEEAARRALKVAGEVLS